MGREYDIKDILLEAGSRDYAEMKNVEWTPSEKHAEFTDKLFKKKKSPDPGNISKLVRACVATAAVAAVVCLCLAVRPLREAIASAAENIIGTGENTSYQTDKTPKTEPADTEKQGFALDPAQTTNMTTTAPETEAETEPETTEEPPFVIPTTDEEWIRYLISSMAKTGYVKEKWERLLSYGDFAFEYLYEMYTHSVTYSLKQMEKSYISAYFAEQVYDEITETAKTVSLLRYVKFPDKTDLTLDDKNWLTNFTGKAQSYAKAKSIEYVSEHTPVTRKLLELSGFDENDFNFDYYSDDVIKSIKKLATLNEGEELHQKLHIVLNSAVYGENIGVMLDAYYDSAAVFGEKETEAKALIGYMYLLKALDDMNLLVGHDKAFGYYNIVDDTVDYYTYTNISGYNLFSYKEKMAEIITKYLKDVTDVLKEKKFTEQIVSEDYPATYALLQKAGFDGYEPPQNEKEKRAAQLLSELENLYNAVKYGYNGYTTYDGLAEVYETDDDISKMSAELYAKVRKYYPEGMYKNPSYQAFHSQKEGFETLDDWYDYYSKILPEDVVRNFLSCENRYFFTANGKVYTTEYMSIYLMKIDGRTARIVEEKNGVTTVRFNAGDSRYVKNTEYTVKVKEDGGVMRIVGGSFIDDLMSFPEYGNAAAFVKAAVWSLSPSNLLVEYENFYGKKEDELPEGFAKKLTEYFGDAKRYYHYFRYIDIGGTVINSVDHYKEAASEFFSSDFINKFFKDNKNFIEADGTLYVSDNCEESLCADEIYSVKRLSDTRYEIEMRVIQNGVAPGIPTWDCTAEVEMIDGSPVIVGGTFLTEVLLKNFKSAW